MERPKFWKVKDDVLENSARDYRGMGTIRNNSVLETIHTTKIKLNGMMLMLQPLILLCQNLELLKLII
jgi:hypothetical protein